MSEEESSLPFGFEPQDHLSEFEESQADDTSDVSPNSTVEKSKKFLKRPILSQFFTISPGSKERRESICNACTKKLRTNENDRLATHLKKCPLVSREDREKFCLDYYTLSLASISRQDKLCAKMFAENNYSLRSVQSKSFREYSHELCPSYTPPSRQVLSDTLIPAASYESDAKFKKIWARERHALSIEFDHWSDANRKNLFGIVATFTDGAKYLCSLRDSSLEGHSTISIVDALKDGLAMIPKDAINALVSDSAISCQYAREALVEGPHYYHVVQHRCMAHLMNRIGWHFEKDRDIAEALRWATRVSSFVSGSTRIQATLRERGINQVKRATPTRWYSTAVMISSLLDAKEVIVEAAHSLLDTNLKDVIVEELHWLAITSLTTIYFPLATCIGAAERHNGSLGEAVQALLELGKFLFEQDWDHPVIVQAVKSYLTYFSVTKLGKAEFRLLLGAYVLDRRYKLDYLNEAALDLALEGIIEMAKKSGISPSQSQKKLLPEYHVYCRFEDDYSTEADGESAASWWSKRRDSGSLQRVALRFAHLKSSSANIERTFSAIKYVQGSWRMNLSLDTMRDLTRLRLNKKPDTDNLADDFNESLALEDIPREEDDSIELQESDISFDEEIIERANIFANRRDRELFSNFNELFSFSKVTIVRSQPQEINGPRISDLVEESRIQRQLWSQSNSQHCNSGEERSIEDQGD